MLNWFDWFYWLNRKRFEGRSLVYYFISGRAWLYPWFRTSGSNWRPSINSEYGLPRHLKEIRGAPLAFKHSVSLADPVLGINSSQQPLFQNFTDISRTVDNAKDKNIRFGNLVNNSEFILDDLPVFKVRGS